MAYSSRPCVFLYWPAGAGTSTLYQPQYVGAFVTFTDIRLETKVVIVVTMIIIMTINYSSNKHFCLSEQFTVTRAELFVLLCSATFRLFKEACH